MQNGRGRLNQIFRLSVYGINGGNDSLCRSGVDNNVINIAVDKVIYRKRTALIANELSLKACKSKILAALYIGLTCCTVLTADLYRRIQAVKNSVYRSFVCAGVECGVVAPDDELLRSFIIRFREINLLRPFL